MTDPTPHPDEHDERDDPTGADTPLPAAALDELRVALRSQDVEVDELRRAAAIRAALDVAGPAAHVADPLPARPGRTPGPWRGLAVAAVVVLVFGGLVAGLATSGTGDGSEDASTGASADATAAQEMAPPQETAPPQEMAPSPDADGAEDDASGGAATSTAPTAAGDAELRDDAAALPHLGEFSDVAQLRAGVAAIALAESTMAAPAGPGPEAGVCGARVEELGARVLGTATLDGADVLVVWRGDPSSPEVLALVVPDCNVAAG